MQIQPSWAANAAAGNVSQATSKDRSSGTPAAAVQMANAVQVEQVARAEQSSADRDAQGGGAGLGSPGQRSSPEELAATDNPIPESLPVASSEPPSELDIVG